MGITFSSDSSHTAQVMYGVAPDLPQPLPRGLGRDEKERDTQIQTQVQIQARVRIERYKIVKDIRKDISKKKPSFLSACFGTSLLAISRVHLHGIFNHPRGHQRPGAQGNQTSQGCPAVRNKVSVFYHLA